MTSVIARPATPDALAPLRVLGAANQNGAPSGYRPSERSFSWPLKVMASRTRSAAVPGKYESRICSPALSRPKPVVMGLWKWVTSLNVIQPRAGIVVAGGAHFFGLAGSA